MDFLDASDQAQNLKLRMGSLSLTGVSGGGVGQTFATWSPTDKDADLSLSAGNLKVTSGSAGGYRNLRSTLYADLGQLKYFEVHLDTFIEAVVVAAQNENLGLYPGSTSAGLAYYLGSTGSIFTGNATLASGVGGAVLGDTVGVAIRRDDRKAFFRVNGGNWEGNAAHDPVTNTGGYSLASMLPDSSWHPFAMAAMFSDAASCTVNFGASPWAFTPPTGFTGFFQ